MKKLSFLAVLIMGFIISCGFGTYDDAKSLPVKTVVTGKITNMHVYPECRDVKIEVQDFRGSEIIYSDSIKKDGTFRIEFDLYITQDVKFTPIVRTFMASPGDSIHIDIDFEYIGKVKFSGNSAKLNDDYHSYINGYYSLNEFSRGERISGEEKFLSFCDSVRNDMFNKKDKYIDKNKPEKRLINWMDKYIKTEYYNAVLNFALKYKFYFKKDINWVNTQEFDSLVVRNENLFDDNILYSKSYKLTNMALYYLGRDYLSDTTLSKEAMLDKIWKDANNLYPNKIFVQLLMGQMFFMEFSRENTDLFENSRKFFNDNVSLKFINEPLLKQYEHIKFHKKNLEIKHNKIIESLGNSSGRILLDSIMNSNKGKVIYIDFWSIGCAPCIAGLPKVKEMQTFFKDTGFDVVYLCLGGPKAVSDKITLNAGIDRNSITCDKDASLELSRAFKILSIPYYVLINREGFIAETGSYLSPMYYETIGKIKNLLK